MLCQRSESLAKAAPFGGVCGPSTPVYSAKPSPAHIVTEARFKEQSEQSERLIFIALNGLETLSCLMADQK